MVVSVPDQSAAARVYRVQCADGSEDLIPADSLVPLPGARMYCPVPGCPCADARRHKGWASLETMRAHLNWHCANSGEGRLPEGWLRDHGKIRCPECGLLCARRNQCCESCWPARRARAAWRARSGARGAARRGVHRTVVASSYPSRLAPTVIFLFYKYDPR